jgi:hypothetical protein
MKPRPQFIFGASVATVYGILMEANIVYGLFFATVIVCALRGGGWWAVYLYGRYRAGRRLRETRLASGSSAVDVPAVSA